MITKRWGNYPKGVYVEINIATSARDFWRNIKRMFVPCETQGGKG